MGHNLDPVCMCLQRVHSSHKFKCWICDDGPMEQLRRRIPGYEHNSKSVLTSLIMQDPRGRGGWGSTGKDSKAESRVGKSGVTDGATAAASKPRPKKATSSSSSSSSASTLSLSETESDRTLPPPCRRQQRRRQQPRSTGSCRGGSQQPASSRQRCQVSESGDESCASEGFPDVYGSEDGSWGGGGGKGRNGQRGNGSSRVAPAVCGTPRAIAPPPGGPGKGATLLDVPYSPPRLDRSGWVGGGGGGYHRSWKNNPPDGEGDSAAGGMSTDSSDSDNDSAGGDGGSNRRRRRGREGKRSTAGGGSGEGGVFEWNRRQLINDLSRGLEKVKIQVRPCVAVAYTKHSRKDGRPPLNAQLKIGLGGGCHFSHPCGAPRIPAANPNPLCCGRGNGLPPRCPFVSIIP